MRGADSTQLACARNVPQIGADVVMGSSALGGEQRHDVRWKVIMLTLPVASAVSAGVQLITNIVLAPPQPGTRNRDLLAGYLSAAGEQSHLYWHGLNCGGPIARPSL